MRGDVYNGLTSATQPEPRLGVAYNIKQSNTVLRVSYARTLETPFNENLVLSSIGCASPVLGPLLSCSSNALTPLSAGFRNEFHAGLLANLEEGENSLPPSSNLALSICYNWARSWPATQVTLRKPI